MFNFIKNFGCSIVNSSQHSSSDVVNLKLEDLNVRKCINLELHAHIIQRIYPSASIAPSSKSLSLVETVSALIRCQNKHMNIESNLLLELLSTILQIFNVIKQIKENQPKSDQQLSLLIFEFL